MTTAWIGLGANLGDAVATVRSALAALDRLPGSRRVVTSSLYRSRPLGPADQPDYINAVAALETDLSASDLLSHLQRIEADHGRIRSGLRWGPRTLDLDILLHGDTISSDARLTLPHPGLCQRPFVLHPLHEVAPQLAIPGHGVVQALLAGCPPDGLDVIASA